MRKYNPDPAEFEAMVIAGVIAVAILWVLSWIVRSCGGGAIPR